MAPDRAAAAVPALVSTGDLEAIRERGFLRILVPGGAEPGIPRWGGVLDSEIDTAQAFARHLGVEAQLVPAEAHLDVIPMLLAGKGDLVSAQLAVTEARSRRMLFSRPLLSLDEVLVGRRGASGLPREPAELDGRTVHVARGSSHVDALAQLAEEHEVTLQVEEVDARVDLETLAHRVALGTHELTVLDSNLLQVLQQDQMALEALLPVHRGRPVAWAVREDNPDLHAAANTFLTEYALGTHTRELFVGDLAAIRERGELRVLTRNNPVTYFIYRGQQLGFDFELVEAMAEALGVRLRVVVPPGRDLLIPWLLEGRGDLVAASITVTSDRSRRVAFSEPYLFVDEMLVQRAKGEGRVRERPQLAGTTVHVRPSSSYASTLGDLQTCCGPITIGAVDEATETVELLEQVAEGVIEFTVADSHILAVEESYDPRIEGAFSLQTIPEGRERPRGARVGDVGNKPIAFAMRPANPELRRFADGWVRANRLGTFYNVVRKRYFGGGQRIARARDQRAAKSGQLSPYDDLLKEYARRYDLDWRLLAAQAYQESRFDPRAKSWAGAIGLFQVMPATGRELGFVNLTDPEHSVHAGSKYLHQMIDRFETSLGLRQRIRFALAAYNAGYGHVADARRLANELGLDGDRWFANTEKAMALLERPRYYRRARYGYVRGSEPVQYVSKIQLRYDNYVKIFPE